MVTAIARRSPALWLDKYFFQPQISGMKLRIAHRQIAALTRVEVAVVIICERGETFRFCPRPAKPRLMP